MMSEHLVFLPCYQPQNERKDILISNNYENNELQFPSLDNELNKELERQKLINKYFLIQNDNNELNINKKKSLINSVWLLCFNRQTKITPDVFEDWMQMLIRSPGN
jgi:predicted O-linked N-acetylglucosamine transferase (SPINDLY family)